MPIIATILFFVWAAAILVAFWAMHLARRFATRLPEHAKRAPDPARARVAVILPIKGVDEDTEANLQALLKQDYADYRLIFSVESEDDPAVGLIERMAAHCPRGKVEIVVAGQATERGQKVHNQLAAVERTDDRDEILAFMDADAHPSPGWLHALVAPLENGSHVGAATGYRYYYPETPHVANSILSVINAGVATLFGPSRRTFAWGGSMALRRRDFFEYGIHSAWQNAVSDDFVLSHCVKHKTGKKIHYVARCIVPSAANFTWSSLFEFATRQYRITRVCAPFVWLAAITGPVLYLLSLVYTFVRTIQSAVLPLGGEWPYEPYIAAAMFTSLYGMNVMRGYFILQGARKLLPGQWEAIRKTAFWLTFGHPLVQAVNLAALVGSAFGRTIVWRGITYVMLSRTRTLVRRPVTAAVEEPRVRPLEPAGK